MRIVAVKTLAGPNIYSFNPVVRAIIDIGKYEDIPSNCICSFTARLLSLLPGLYQHHCSRGRPGGFAERLYEGTYLAHIFEHVAIELQCLAGYSVSYGKTRGTGKTGIYDVVIGYINARAAEQAVFMAHQLLVAVVANLPFNVEDCVNTIKSTGEATELGPSTAVLCQAAFKRKIPVTRLADDNLLLLGYGYKSKRIWASMTGFTGVVAADIATDKQLTKKILDDNGLNVPVGEVVSDPVAAVKAWRKLGRPAVLKPLTGNQGKGVTVAVNTAAEVERAFISASQYDKSVLVEEYIAGRQYRLCVVDGQMVAAAERIPAYVIGDGRQTVEQLVALTNADPNRGDGHSKRLSKIIIDAIAVTVLAKQNFTPASVPTAGQVVQIRNNANLSTGGTAVDVTDVVHPDNAFLAERAAKLIGLDVAGIDIVAEDITRPIKPGTGAIIEVNAAPGLRMHHYPSAGKTRDVAGHIINYLFPNGSDGRIPVFAITGTNGKTTVTRMISHIWKQAGYNVGMTTTDGIYINDKCVLRGDTTGPDSAKIVLSDPGVEVAVLETARGGIIRGGLAFDKSDVGIVTNITEDHLGQDGIETLEDLAYIKLLVVETLKPDGIALLNADDPYVTAMAAKVKTEIAYFSMEANNIVVRRHLGAGGKAFFIQDGIIYSAAGAKAQPIIPVAEIPVTLGGIAMHNMQNAMIAAAACYCRKVPLNSIRQGLATFDENPGRLTMLDVAGFRVCIDYGHNPAGYQALINTVRRMGAKRLVGVIGAPGDRRDDVTINTGRMAGCGFDYIYIKEDSDLRGRKQGETAALLRQGVLEAGFSPDRLAVILGETAAVYTALSEALPGDLLVIFFEKYDQVRDVIDRFIIDQKLPKTDLNVSKTVVVAAACQTF